MRYVCSLIILNLFLISNVFSSTFIKVSDKKLLERAEHIISGKVSKITTELENNTPFQYIEILISKVYKTKDISNN